MRVMVTGGGGFIGTSLVRKLIRDGHDVIELVRSPTSNSAPQSQKVVWDIGSGDRPRLMPDKLDALVHLAQARNYRTFPQDVPEMFRVNVQGTAALLYYAAEIGVRHFCFASSGTVYEPYCGELKEDAALDPPSYLGASKLAGEIIARPFNVLFPLSILRLFFPYGPGQKNRLVPDLIDRVRNGRAVQVTSDGEGLRLVPTFVEDVVNIISTAIVDGWTGTFNVASSAVVTMRELAEAIGVSVARKPIFQVTEERTAAVVPNVDRLRSRFEFDRFTTLETGLMRVLAAKPQGE